MDASKEEEMRVQLEHKFQKYHEFREKVLTLREEDRVARNVAKEKQIEQYEDMQVGDLPFSLIRSSITGIASLSFILLFDYTSQISKGNVSYLNQVFFSLKSFIVAFYV